MGLYQSLKIDNSNRGKKFGHRTQLGASFSLRIGTRRDRYCVCECDCGNVAVVNSRELNTRRSTICKQCRLKETQTENTKHGMCGTRIYRIWCNMIRRCTRPTHKGWDDYGGRGITVCDRWRESFEMFVEDMGMPPTAKHEMDRVDNDGNYEPSNVVWATRTEQIRNRRITRRFDYLGQMLTIPQISELTGVPYRRLKQRIQRGWEITRAII